MSNFNWKGSEYSTSQSRHHGNTFYGFIRAMLNLKHFDYWLIMHVVACRHTCKFVCSMLMNMFLIHWKLNSCFSKNVLIFCTSIHPFHKQGRTSLPFLTSVMSSFFVIVNKLMSMDVAMSFLFSFCRTRLWAVQSCYINPEWSNWRLAGYIQPETICNLALQIMCKFVINYDKLICFLCSEELNKSWLLFTLLLHVKVLCYWL